MGRYVRQNVPPHPTETHLRLATVATLTRTWQADPLERKFTVLGHIIVLGSREHKHEARASESLFVSHSIAS